MKFKSLLAASLLLTAGAVQAEQCEATIDSTDSMQYGKKEMTVPKSCDEFTVTLTHSGTMDKNVMGHNWVLAKEGDAQAIATDGMTAGMENNYLKPDDERVIAATKIIGGGEETSVTFSVDELSGADKYTFFCSFPGHLSMMQGTLMVK
ncbi:azurin [Salinimonas marina]|uniref:Azurin n=1 Tax=Salinimonas marina TaxID=2785918 RepID=A0A7S9DVL8_9ALTE|nr:azurin [Salinimonas marina]QPG04748.1 azurin [Salinimonas marina]